MTNTHCLVRTRTFVRVRLRTCQRVCRRVNPRAFELYRIALYRHRRDLYSRLFTRVCKHRDYGLFREIPSQRKRCFALDFRVRVLIFRAVFGAFIFGYDILFAGRSLGKIPRLGNQ